MTHAMRGLPAVHRLLDDPSIAPYESLVGRTALRRAVAATLDGARAASSPLSSGALVEQIVERLDAIVAQTLLPVVNATGTLLHTNLGRAPLAAPALSAVAELAAGYSNLEYDAVAGERGSRYARLTDLLCELTGAEDALVVNNCAAAVLLVLDTFARGCEVVVSRGQLIEIGGGFRLPDVLARSGATLVEVGTTNRVYRRDVEAALTPRTTLLLHSHRSNYTIEGFTHDVSPTELVAIGRRAGVAVAEDLGSGALVDLAEYGLPHERTVQEAVGDGVSLVAFSGDKLLGGPQAGVLVGTSAAIARLRSNPLLRALRVDKVTIALLAATLRLYRTRETRERIPLYAMLAMPLERLRERGVRYAARVPSARLIESVAYVGGGALPGATLPSIAVAVDTRFPVELAARLRRRRMPIVGRTEGDCVLLDLRTIAPAQDAYVIAALASIDT